MDKLMPPANGSPEEIEAWNKMMDTMVTFIRASTNLMNTITHNVRPTPGAPAGPAALMNLMEGCEPECEMCIPKPKSPCGVCTASKHTRKSLTDTASAKKASSIIKSKASSTPSSKAKVVSPPEGDAAPDGEVELPADAPPEAEEQSAPLVEEEEQAPLAEEQEQAPREAEEEPAPPKEEPAPSAPKEAPITQSAEKPAETAKTDQPGGDTNTGCVCSAIRAKKLENKKATEALPPTDEEQSPQEPIPEDQLCACGPTPGNHEALVQDMVQKLANAQQEIDVLQEEMARLQRMDATKRTSLGGPNPAALYREIMRDNDVQDPCPRDRSSQRIPQQARQRFQTQNSGIDCSECPGNRSMPNQGRRPYPTSTRGYDMAVPAEGMQVPQGFVSGVPQLGSNYGIPQAMPRQVQQVQRQGSMQQASLQQRSMQMNMQQPNMAASRQGMPNRTAPQGGVTQIPCRGGSGGASGIRNYQDSQQSAGSFRSLQNFQEPPPDSSRRIIMCGPPRPQNGCNSNCPHR